MQRARPLHKERLVERHRARAVVRLRRLVREEEGGDPRVRELERRLVCAAQRGERRPRGPEARVGRDGSEEGLARESGLGELAEDDAMEVVPEAVEAFALARSSQLRVEEREVLVARARLAEQRARRACPARPLLRLLLRLPLLACEEEAVPAKEAARGAARHAECVRGALELVEVEVGLGEQQLVILLPRSNLLRRRHRRVRRARLVIERAAREADQLLRGPLGGALEAAVR
mmetsp:Transcript_41015/g.135905  ORF Transcript_41015/g.135905 Transcript_41015/m.135905 type:complete len:233 (-) Transcript_41015:79-777(-)